MNGSGISETGAASRTALITACSRGMHLLRHGPRAVLSDWLAWPLVGSQAEALMMGMRSAFGDAGPLLGSWVAARSRFTEDWLTGSAARQYVILGAGLDSFAWRQTLGLSVFEVDHPATQAWKRSRLEALGVAVPGELVWVPVDFEAESVADGLGRVGLGSSSTFVSWLGVIQYLSLDAIAATLRDLPPCSLAVSYSTPEDLWPEAVRAGSATFRAMAVEAGEPPVSLFAPDQIAAVLADCGFLVAEDVGFEDVEARYGLPALSVGNERIALATKDPNGGAT